MAPLLLLLACGPGTPAEEALVARSSAEPGQEMARNYLPYERGRRAEIARLEVWLARSDTLRSAELDETGAAAAQRGLERYRWLVKEVDSVLVEWGSTGLLDRRLQRLDSLRVERRVLLVRVTMRGEEHRR